MQFRYTTLLVLVCLGISPYVQATIINSQQNGNWNSTATWSGGEIPEAGDTVHILAGDTVTLTDSRSCLRLEVEAGGKFNLNHDLDGYSSIYNNGHIAWAGGDFKASGDVENNNRLDILGAFSQERTP